jgi:hypothetical protein
MKLFEIIFLTGSWYLHPAAYSTLMNDAVFSTAFEILPISLTWMAQSGCQVSNSWDQYRQVLYIIHTTLFDLMEQWSLTCDDYLEAHDNSASDITRRKN